MALILFNKHLTNQKTINHKILKKIEVNEQLSIFVVMLNENNIVKFKFPKQQRLTHKKRITELFVDGISVKAFPFRIKFLSNTLTYHRILMAVPKRNIPLANNRNTIKRLMREAFRLNQHQLIANPEHLDILLIFTGREKPHFTEVENELLKLFQKIQLQIESNNSL